MREQLCPYSQFQLKCPLKNCILNDAELINFVRHFVFKPEYSSLPFGVIRERKNYQFFDIFDGLWFCLPSKMKRALRVIEFFLDFLRTDKQPGKLMTQYICRDIRTLRRRFDRFIREKD